MLNMDPGELRKALEQLEQATHDHVEWHENLLRALVCRLPFALNDLEERAHLDCLFGRWYYERALAELWGQPAFAAIGTEHERLHLIAARYLTRYLRPYDKVFRYGGIALHQLGYDGNDEHEAQAAAYRGRHGVNAPDGRQRRSARASWSSERRSPEPADAAAGEIPVG